MQRVAGTRGSAQLQPRDGLSQAGSGELGERLLAPSRSASQLAGLGRASGEPLLLRGIAGRPPVPGRDGYSSAGSLPILPALVAGGALAVFPFHECL